MLTLLEARAEIFSRIKQGTEVEIVPVSGASNRFIAQDVIAQVANPAFDNSAMDGYALCVAELNGPDFSLPLAGEASCGMAPDDLTPGTTMRIFTGAPLPVGADTVEIQENISLDGDNVTFPGTVSANQNIRRKGEDFSAGDILYNAGRQLLPMDLGLLATAGISELAVYKKPQVLVIATGNELVSPGDRLKPGQIYESNKLVTLTQLQALGMDAIDGGTVGDNPEVLRERLAAATEYDFVVTSGGASVGDHDLVKQVFAEMGSVDLWRVKIKPGKPVAFGLVGDKTHFFALPGNPLSSLITFKLFVEPALYYWNHASYVQLELDVVAGNSFKRKAGRMEFLRANIYTGKDKLRVDVLPGQGSHMIGALRHTNGLIRLSEESPGFNAGDTVSVIPLHTQLVKATG